MNSEIRGSVLIVDDNPTNLRTLLGYLEKSGFDILVATSGERALKQLERIRPDLILLDVLMPGMDGFETCRRLKANDLTRNIPVIFMTALTETIDKIKGFEVGGVDYLTKPLQYQELIARITTHLTIRKLQQQLEVQNARLGQQNLKLEERNAQLQQEISKRKQMEEFLRQHTHRLALLNQMSDLLQACRTEEDTYDVLVHVCKQLFPLSSGTLSLMNDLKTELVVRASWVIRRTNFPNFPKTSYGGFLPIIQS